MRRGITRSCWTGKTIGEILFVSCVVRALNERLSQVHYLLGSYVKEVAFERDTWQEIKIDYGTWFEKVRIKNDYPRVTGAKLAALKKEISEEDSDFIGTFYDAPLSVIAEYLAFLTLFTNEQTARGRVALQDAQERALFTALLSLKRLADIARQFVKLSRHDSVGTNGKSMNDVLSMKEQAKAALSKTAERLGFESLKGMISKDVFRKTLREWLDVASVDDVHRWMTC